MATAREVDPDPAPAPPDLRRLLFVRQGNAGRVVAQLEAYDLYAIPGRPELTVYQADQGFVAVSCPPALPRWHFLNLVSWLTDAVGDYPLAHRFDGVLGIVGCPSDPTWDYAAQTDPEGEGSVVAGVDPDGRWWRYPLPDGVRRDEGRPLLEVGTSAAHLSFLSARGVPRRLWDDPGAEHYLAVEARVQVGS